VALAVFAPNIWWNLQTGGTTVEHTLYNAEWKDPAAGPDLAGGLRFLVEQFAVFGPILFAAYLLLILRAPFGLRFPHAGLLLWLSAPVTADFSADLHYTLRDAGDLKLHALPSPGFPASYYEQAFPVPADTSEPVLLATLDRKPACARLLARWTPKDGAYDDQTIYASRVTPDCLKTLMREGFR